MSRRDDRDSESRLRRSMFDREPSPKRSRRDRTAERSKPGSGDRAEQNEKQRRRLQDALPLDPPLGPDNKSDKRTSSKEANNKGYGDSEGAKNSSDPSKVPLSRSFSQHDERNHAGQGSQSASLRTTSERGWWKDYRVQRDEQEPAKKSRDDDSRRGEKSNRREDGWKHDRFLEMEANPPPPPLTRKRPSFREQKNHNDGKSKRDASKTNSADLQESEIKDDKYHRYERIARGDVPQPYRYGGGGNRFSGRGESYNNARRQQQQQPHYNNRMPTNTGVEKWRHDMFDESNRSPDTQKDEDRLAKIEALLAS